MSNNNTMVGPGKNEKVALWPRLGRSEFPAVDQVRDAIFRGRRRSPPGASCPIRPKEVMAQCPRARQGTADLKSGGPPYRFPKHPTGLMDWISQPRPTGTGSSVANLSDR